MTLNQEKFMLKQYKINVALVSDFCYPFLGGVQIHILKLAQYLLNKVNKVIIITHHYPGHVGIKIQKGIKFYYLKLPYHKNLNIIYGTFSLTFFLLKNIFQQQQINLVHGHSSISPMSQEAILCAGVLGIRTINTEHSLYSVKEMFDIHTSKCVQILTVLLNKTICVSRTTRNNYLLRSQIQTQKVIVIPNAAEIKTQSKTKSPYNPKNPIKIIFVGRLTYRRGVDLLIDVLDEFIPRFSEVKFIVIGEGVKMPILQKFISENEFQSKVEILGSVKNEQVINIMQDCDIFINTPLTESFGIALIEAALQGVLCVSTQVGGITEVLPKSLLITTKPSKNEFIKGLTEAIYRVKQGRVQTNDSDVRLIKNYNWENISNRVLDVYTEIFREQRPVTRKQVLKKIIKKEKIIGYFYLLLYIILCLINDIHEWLQMRSKRKQNTESIKDKFDS